MKILRGILALGGFLLVGLFDGLPSLVIIPLGILATGVLVLVVIRHFIVKRR